MTAATPTARRKPAWIGYAAIAAIFILPAGMYAAPYLLGPRGDLLALLFQWLLEAALTALFTLLCFVLWRSAKSALKWLALAAFLLFAAFTLFGIVETVLSAIDLALPYNEQHIVIAKTWYEHPQTGRGAVPESGGWHLVTADGHDYALRNSADGKALHPGPYTIHLTPLKKIVMDAQPVQ